MVEQLRICRICRDELPLERFNITARGGRRRTECGACFYVYDRLREQLGRVPSTDEILEKRGRDVPGGASREEVARALKITPADVEAIERRAIEKLARRFRQRLFDLWEA